MEIWGHYSLQVVNHRHDRDEKSFAEEAIHPPKPQIMRQGCHLLELDNAEPEKLATAGWRKTTGSACLQGKLWYFLIARACRSNWIRFTHPRKEHQYTLKVLQTKSHLRIPPSATSLHLSGRTFFPKGLGSGPRHTKRIEEQTEHMLAQKHSTYCNATQL